MVRFSILLFKFAAYQGALMNFAKQNWPSDHFAYCGATEAARKAIFLQKSPHRGTIFLFRNGISSNLTCFGQFDHADSENGIRFA